MSLLLPRERAWQLETRSVLAVGGSVELGQSAGEGTAATQLVKQSRQLKLDDKFDARCESRRCPTARISYEARNERCDGLP